MNKIKHLFALKSTLQDKIDAYFNYNTGEYHTAQVPAKKGADPTELVEQKVWDRDPEPSTLTGLAFALGFNSVDDFDTYETEGKYAGLIKRARLRIQAEYEKKLHVQSSTGAVFALKSMGWNEKPDKVVAADHIRSIKVKIIKTGPQPAASEKEVVQ